MSDSKLLQAILKKVSDIDRNQKFEFNKVNETLDMIGSSVAFLGDNTPTRKKHDDLEKRVTKIEKKLVLT